MAMIDDLALVMALLIGVAIGLALAIAHYQRASARQQGYEQEAARDEELRAAAQAARRRYRADGPRNRTARFFFPEPGSRAPDPAATASSFGRNRKRSWHPQ